MWIANGTDDGPPDIALLSRQEKHLLGLILKRGCRCAPDYAVMCVQVCDVWQVTIPDQKETREYDTKPCK